MAGNASTGEEQGRGTGYAHQELSLHGLIAPRMMCIMNWHVGIVVMVAKANLADGNGL